MNTLRIITRLFALVLLSFTLSTGASAQQASSANNDADKREASDLFESPRVTLNIPLTSPLFREVPIASVNDETILLKELTSALATTHEGRHTDAKTKAASMNFSDVLKRLINMKLVVHEGREMGMDELPDVKQAVQRNRRPALMSLLIDDITKDVKADEVEVEKIRKEMSREWKVRSVLFEKEEDAKKMEEEIKAGKSFEELAAAATEEKIAKDQGEGGYVRPKDLLPDVAAVVSKMEVGSVSPVIKVGSDKDAGFTIIKLEEIRYPEDPEVTEQAREVVLDAASAETVRKFKEELIKNNVKINKKIMDGLDFEAKKPGFAAMLKDKRTVATVKGDKPLTVGDLAEAISGKFFHGVERGIRDKEVNAKKVDILNELLEKRLFDKEIAKRGLENTEAFKNIMNKHEEAVIFGLFVQRVLVPDVKLTHEEVKAYYESHADDYRTPEMMKISGLVFGTRKQAEGAFERLEKGADFNWLKSNAEGQMDKSEPGVLRFEGNTVVMKNLPEGIRKALSGSRPEEHRLYESPEGHFYVLYVRDVVPSGLEPFEEVRVEIAKKIYSERLNAALEQWVATLKDSFDVKVYLSIPMASGKDAGKH